MEVKYTEQKLKIFENILAVNDKDKLLELQYIIKNFISENGIVYTKRKKSKTISFEEWNKQFIDNRDLDEYIPEYGMTLGDFRRQIYKAEFGKSMSLNEFENKVKEWKNKHAKSL